MDYLKTHERFHNGEKPYDCEQCDKSFTTTGSLRTHMRIHSRENPYTCEQCDKEFQSIYSPEGYTVVINLVLVCSVTRVLINLGI